jgi:hypothetical protein
MQIDTQLGWAMARWNLGIYLAVTALVFALGGLDPAVALAS